MRSLPGCPIKTRFKHITIANLRPHAERYKGLRSTSQQERTTPPRQQAPAYRQGSQPVQKRPSSPAPAHIAASPFVVAQRSQIDDNFGPAIQPKTKNQTGLPDNLKSGVESLSGMSMDSVRVHYNSAQPAQLNALAYAQGSDIHLAPGQEQHLPHEAWHVVQQAQGRVQATMQMKDGVPVNDDTGLEHEADVMGAKALAPTAQLAGGPEAGELSYRPPVLNTHTPSPQVPVAQLNGKKRRARKKNKEQQREQRRHDAEERLQRGSPDEYNHLDPEVAANLAELDKLQPRKTATRKNIDSRAQRLREANLPSVVEVGAGEGRFSSAFARKFGDNYQASDIAASTGPNGFLGEAGRSGFRTKFGVNANELDSHFRPGSLKHIVGANPFGVKGVGGASYGLKVENPKAKGKNKYLPDDRFLNTARPLLKPGGSVELYGRSNVIRDAKLAKYPTKGLRGAEATEAERKRKEISTKYPGENANPYLATSPSELHDLAKRTKYKATVKRAKQPLNIGKGGNPDTKSGDKERAAEGLKPFNTRLTFTPEEEGYESGEDDPRVTYLSDDESDWEE
jgi:Domain of unknown function (DUF4157)